MLENDERSCGMKPIYPSLGNPKPLIVSKYKRELSQDQQTYLLNTMLITDAGNPPATTRKSSQIICIPMSNNTLLLFTPLSLGWFAMWYTDPAYLIAMRSPMWPETFCLKSPSI